MDCRSARESSSANAADLWTGSVTRLSPTSTWPTSRLSPKDAGRLVALADAVLEARHGDPDICRRAAAGVEPAAGLTHASNGG